MRLRRISPNNRQGFTLMEFMVAGFIMIVIMGAMVMALRVGDISTTIGTESTDLEADVRSIMSLMVRDIRQAKIQELNANVPTANYLKYNVWVWNNTPPPAQEETYNYVEYEYDGASRNLTRRYIVNNTTVENEWTYTDIAMPPFYTNDTYATTGIFNRTYLLDNRRLIIAITKEKVVGDNLVNFTLAEEIRIRNE